MKKEKLMLCVEEGGGEERMAHTKLVPVQHKQGWFQEAVGRSYAVATALLLAGGYLMLTETLVERSKGGLGGLGLILPTAPNLPTQAPARRLLTAPC